MSDDEPKRDGIAEILASGRAPGLIVRGSRHVPVEYVPGLSAGPADPRERKAQDDRAWDAGAKAFHEAKHAHGSSRRDPDKVRHIGRMSLEAHLGMKKAYGDDYTKDPKAALREHGILWDKT